MLIPAAWHHATEAMLMIALAPAGQPMRSGHLAEALGLPARYLEVRLQRLVHSGLLRSLRGPRGGYVLHKPREAVTLLEVVLSAEELTREELSAPGQGDYLAAQMLAPVWAQGAQAMLAHLGRTTLEDLCLKAYRERRVEGTSTVRIDYAI